MDHYSIRPATGFDERFLWDMLYLAIYVPPQSETAVKGDSQAAGSRALLGRLGASGRPGADRSQSAGREADWGRLDAPLDSE